MFQKRRRRVFAFWGGAADAGSVREHSAGCRSADLQNRTNDFSQTEPACAWMYSMKHTSRSTVVRSITCSIR
ncbi:MAG: hypothetical protein MUE48_01110, partial [Desulfobacterales bacterium]|nr:hypothetical protein [Desulfobacterales bacterium]